MHGRYDTPADHCRYHRAEQYYQCCLCEKKPCMDYEEPWLRRRIIHQGKHETLTMLR